MASPWLLQCVLAASTSTLVAAMAALGDLLGSLDTDADSSWPPWGMSWRLLRQNQTETDRDRQLLAALGDLSAALVTETQTETDRDRQRQTALGRSGGSLGGS